MADRVSSFRPLTGLARAQLDAVTRLLHASKRRGRPWSRSLRQRVLIACTGLRTNLTGARARLVVCNSKSQAHRILADLTPRLAALLDRTVERDRGRSWVVDGTLVPVRDHGTAA